MCSHCSAVQCCDPEYFWIRARLTGQLLEVSILLKLQDLGADDLGEVAALLDGDGQGLLREGFAHLREVAVLAQKDIIMKKCTIKGDAMAR